MGPEDGEGIRIYYGGMEAGSDTTNDRYPIPPGEGRIVIGKLDPDLDGRYASVQVDELMFFNSKLTDPEIMTLAQI